MGQDANAATPWLIVLGSALALSTSLIMEWLRMSLMDRRTKKMMCSLLKNELPIIVDVLRNILDAMPRQGFIPFRLVAEVDSMRQGFDRNRDWVVLFREESFRRDIIAFYKELGSVCRDANVVENYASSPTATEAHHAWIQSERARLSSMFQELANQARVLLTRLDKQ